MLAYRLRGCSVELPLAHVERVPGLGSVHVWIAKMKTSARISRSGLNTPFSSSQLRAVSPVNRIFESFFCAKLCRYAEDLTSTRTPLGVSTSKLLQLIRNLVFAPRAFQTMNSAKIPRVVSRRPSPELADSGVHPLKAFIAGQPRRWPSLDPGSSLGHAAANAS